MSNTQKLYFVKGFSLLNQNLLIYFVSIIFLLIELFQNFITPYVLFPLGRFLLSLLTAALPALYLYVLPLLFEKASLKQKINVDIIIKSFLQTAKRIILPSLTILLIGSLLLFGFAVAIGALLKILGLGNSVNIGVLLFTVILALFVFVESFHPFLTMLSHQSFFKSLIHSVSLVIKGYRFMLLVAACTLGLLITNQLIFQLTGLLPSPIKEIVLTMFSLVGLYLRVGIYATIFFYFKEKIQPNLRK